MSRSRSFFITVNHDIELFVKTITKEKYSYLVIGPIEEAPSTGHKHCHAYIHYSNQKNMKTMVNTFNSFGDVEIARGSGEQCRKYVCKTGDPIFETGNIPVQGKRSDLASMLESCMSVGEFRYRYPDIFLRYHNGIRDYYESSQGETVLDHVLNSIRDGSIHKNKVLVIYITGPSGIGKSSAAIKYAVECYANSDIGEIRFDDNGYCKGVRLDAKCLIWHEFRDTQLKFDELLMLLDKYGYVFNVKGSKKPVKPECIIIDSSKPLESLYKNIKDEQRKQLYRRITRYCTVRDHELLDITIPSDEDEDIESNF